MGARQSNKMREVYQRFPNNLKSVLSKIRIIEHANLSIIPKSERKEIVKELKELRDKQKTIINFEVEMPKRDRNIIKSHYKAFCLQVDILGTDLLHVDKLIEESRNEIRDIKGNYDEYNRAKRRESNKMLVKLKAKQTMYHVAREAIQHKHDVMRSDSKYGYQAIKIRRQIEKKQRGQIKKIDTKIEKLMQTLYSY